MNITSRKATVRKLSLSVKSDGTRLTLDVEVDVPPDDPLRVLLSRGCGTRPDQFLPPPEPDDAMPGSNEARVVEAETRALWSHSVEVRARRPAEWSMQTTVRVWELDDDGEHEEAATLTLRAVDVGESVRFWLAGAECRMRLSLSCQAALVTLPLAEVAALLDRGIAFEMLDRQLTLALTGRAAA